MKKIFDFLPLRVVFTSSVALSLYETAADLSRRARLLVLYPFSFREYLSFARGVSLPPLTLADLLAGRAPEEHLRQEAHFAAYLQGGCLPFALEEPDPLPALANIREKIIRSDISAAAALRVDEPAAVEKTLAFIGKSPAEGINYSSVSRNVGLTKYKAEEYLRLLERAFVVNLLFPAGTNVLREPKVLLAPPWRLLYRGWDEALGALREDFAAQALRAAGYECQYLKSRTGAKTPDFLVADGAGPLAVEVGGKGKGRRQFKGIEVERKLVLAHAGASGPGRAPLHLLGFVEG